MANIYPGKILLFGEYAVLLGGEGLAIPNFDYSMHWDHDPRNTINLSSYYDFLHNDNELQNLFKLTLFSEDIKNYGYLLSTIPEGYGLGSSGAVVAAVYDKYIIDPLHLRKEIPLAELRTQLAKMENFFHGNSSGLDPLVSLLQKPVHLKRGGELEIITGNIKILSQYEIDLFDTNISRQTSRIVETFKEKLKDEQFKLRMENEYLPLINSCINSVITSNFNQLRKYLFQLSEFQLKNFSFAIPLFLMERWENGIVSGNEIFKLCGAGGGGFMLRFLPKN